MDMKEAREDYKRTEKTFEITKSKEARERLDSLSKVISFLDLFDMALIISRPDDAEEFVKAMAPIVFDLDRRNGLSRADDLRRHIAYLEGKKAAIDKKGHKAPKTTATIEQVKQELARLEREESLSRTQVTEYILEPEESGTTTGRMSSATTTSGETRMSKEGQKDLSGADKVHNVEVVRHGEKLLLPENLSIKDAIALLQARDKYEQEVVEIHETYDVFPWDGALALASVLKARFGWVPDRGAAVTVDAGPNGQKVTVPWGSFSLPGKLGNLTCDTNYKDSRWMFHIVAAVMHRDEALVKEIMRDVATELKANSIYRGKAFRVRFLDDKGKALPMPEPKFIDVSNVQEEDVAYATDVQAAIETNLFTPIRRVQELAANRIPVNRGVLLGGKFGTGKTLAAAVATKLALEQNMTCVYVERANELALALAFAKPYQQPAVLLFCEDIDRAMEGGENADRTTNIDGILNSIDGIDTKGDNRIIVLTTNNLDGIQQALLRPGRMDAVIEVTPPDATAAWRLVQIYGGETLADDVDGTAVGKALDGQIPAVIAEVVRRAKLAQLRRTPVGIPITGIGTEALVEAANTMRRQLELLNRGGKQYMPIEEALRVIRAAGEGSPAEVPAGRLKAA